LVADHGDGWFINGQPLDDVRRSLPMLLPARVRDHR
jgi:hypothetical protein